MAAALTRAAARGATQWRCATGWGPLLAAVLLAAAAAECSRAQAQPLAVSRLLKNERTRNVFIRSYGTRPAQRAGAAANPSCARNAIAEETDTNDTGAGTIVRVERTRNAVYVLTAWHVYEKGRYGCLTVAADQSARDFDAELVYQNEVDDWALLEVRGADDALSAPPVTIRNREAVDLGDPAVAIGNPLGNGDRHQKTDLQDVRDIHLVLGIPLQHGYSGGAVYADNGDLIGVIVDTSSNARALSAAVVCHAIDAQRAKRHKTPIFHFVGKPAPPRLGTQLDGDVGYLWLAPLDGSAEYASGAGGGVSWHIPLRDFAAARLRLRLRLGMDVVKVTESILAPSKDLLHGDDTYSDLVRGNVEAELVLLPDGVLQPFVQLGLIGGVQWFTPAVGPTTYGHTLGFSSGAGIQLVPGKNAIVIVGFELGVYDMQQAVYRFDRLMLAEQPERKWFAAPRVYLEGGYGFD